MRPGKGIRKTKSNPDNKYNSTRNSADHNLLILPLILLLLLQLL